MEVLYQLSYVGDGSVSLARAYSSLMSSRVRSGRLSSS